MSLKLSELPPKLRERIEKQIRDEDRDLRGVEAGEPKSAVAQALVGGGSKREAGAGSLAAGRGREVIRVTLIAVIRRRLDDDNLAGACKPLRDAIAMTLGIDDGSERLTWEYGQTLTRGSEGVVVRIEK